MTSLQAELALANRIKRVLEEETGDTYVLKSGEQLVHPELMDWFLHPSIDKKHKGILSDAYQKGDVVTLDTSIIYDVHKRLDFEYRKALERGDTIHDMDKLDQREARRKYSHRFPRIMAFFDKAEELIMALRKSTGVNLILSPGNGLVNFQVEIPAARVSEDESVITESVGALEELDRQMWSWLEDQRIVHESRPSNRIKGRTR